MCQFESYADVKAPTNRGGVELLRTVFMRNVEIVYTRVYIIFYIM